MAYPERHFEKGRPFHVTSRAVEGARIFEKEKDRCRFVFQLQAANLGRPARNAARRNMKRGASKLFQGRELNSSYIKKTHNPFVHILDFALVGNHYHFYLVANIENGVIPFIQRLNLGFAKYFNQKNERRGALFAGRYRAKLVKGQPHSDTVRRYVAIINPLDVFNPDWREKGINDSEKALEFLKKYRFSSFLDNVGEREAGILAPKKIREKYGLPDKQDFLEFAEYFVEKKATRPYSLSCLE